MTWFFWVIWLIAMGALVLELIHVLAYQRVGEELEGRVHYAALAAGLVVVIAIALIGVVGLMEGELWN